MPSSYSRIVDLVYKNISSKLKYKIDYLYLVVYESKGYLLFSSLILSNIINVYASEIPQRQENESHGE